MKKAKFGADRTMKEGSAKDMREDKKLAKKHGMSMKEWESSEMDKRHDKGVKGMADGGQSKAALLNTIQQKVGQMRANPGGPPKVHPSQMDPSKGMPKVAQDPARRAMLDNQVKQMRSQGQMPQTLGPTSPAPMRPTQQAAPAPAPAPSPAPAPTPTAPATNAPSAARANILAAMKAPAAMKSGGCTRGMKAGGVTSAEMKKVGRNLARVANQKASTKGSSKGTMTSTKSSGSTAKISKRGWGIARGG